MTIVAQNIVYRSRRRVRALFSAPLGGGAFVTSWFTFATTDPLGATPTVRAALVVADSPNVAELALSVDLADGAGYALTVAAGVPAADASTTAAPVVLPLRAPTPAAGQAERTASNAAIDALYGVDLDYDGTDFVEGGDGDLQTTRGVANVQSAITRRALSDGLQWRPGYGARPRQFVDAPSPSIGEFRAALISQTRADDRVKSASATASGVLGSLDQYIFAVDAQLIGNIAVSAQIPVKSA